MRAARSVGRCADCLQPGPRPGQLCRRSSKIAAGLIHEVTYKGIRPPSFYVATIVVDNLGYQLRPGMSGTARIYAERRSLVRMAWDAVSNFVHRKIW